MSRETDAPRSFDEPQMRKASSFAGSRRLTGGRVYAPVETERKTPLHWRWPLLTRPVPCRGEVLVSDAFSLAGLKVHLPPGFVEHQRDGVGKIEAPAAGDHRNPDSLLRRYAAKDLGRQSSRFRTKDERIPGDILIQVIPLGTLGGDGEETAILETCRAIGPGLVNGDRGELVVVQPGPPQEPILQRKPQRLDQMQPGSGIGAETDDVAGVRGNFRLEENDIEHGAKYRPRRRLASLLQEPTSPQEGISRGSYTEWLEQIGTQ